MVRSNGTEHDATTADSSSVDAAVLELAPRGVGVARIGGKVIFLPLTAPGDRVRVRVTRDFGRYAFGVVTELIEAGESRTVPVCPVFGECGGCQLQHVAYDTQLAAKRRWVRTALQRIGGVEPPQDPVVASPLTFGYRNKATLHVDGRRVGFLRAQSHEVVANAVCPILQPGLQDVQRGVGEWVESGDEGAAFRVVLRLGTEGEPMVIVHRGRNARPVSSLASLLRAARVVPGGSSATVRFSCAGVRFDAGAESFFQVNTSQMETMVNALRGLLPPSGVLVDGHAGVGWPSLCLAPSYERVVCVEIAGRSCALGRANARRAGYDHVHFHRGVLESAVRSDAVPRRVDAVLLDPPRSGLLPGDVRAAAGLGAAAVVYVSCDPATQARDIRRLAAFGYEPSRCIPFDLFPHTAHVESVVLLLRR